MPKSRKRKKKHIKQAAYADDNFSALEAHPKKGKSLKSPYSKLSNVSFSSWRDNFLPNMLWAAVVGVSVPRDQYLQLFRSVLGRLGRLESLEYRFLAHSWLSTYRGDQFNFIMEPLLDCPDTINSLASLRLLDSLPDREHWFGFVPETMPEGAGTILATAVGASFDHQSELATDIRWLKVMAFLVADRIKFPSGEKFESKIEEIRQFPDVGNMHEVRPSIRSAEMTVRVVENGDHRPEAIPVFDAEEFWSECREKTECIVERNYQPVRLNCHALLDELTELSIGLADHADDVAPHTGIDPRRDAAFGLPLFAISLTIEAACAPTHTLAGGRILLRAVTEAAITLSYLSTKDDDSIWKQYRNYGSGQAKLAFLKAVREDDVPSFIDLDDLHDLANDDTWMEFLDINLASWEKLNLRQMATQAGRKDIYDRYYSWSSGYTHGHWTAVRDTVFTTCMNPLHRFHRVLAPTRQMPSTLDDCCKLINLMLDELNKLYPSFKDRVVWHKSENASDTDDTPPG